MKSYKFFKFFFILAMMWISIFAQSSFCFDINNIQREPKLILAESNQNIENGKSDLRDYVYAAVACMKLNRLQEAHKWIEKGFIHIRTRQEKAGMYAQKAFVFSLEKNYIKALENIKKTIFLEPKNGFYASLYQTYAILSSDELEKDVATTHIQQILPNAAGKEILDPVTGSVIIVSIVCATILVMYYTGGEEQQNLIIRTMPEILKTMNPISQILKTKS